MVNVWTRYAYSDGYRNSPTIRMIDALARAGLWVIRGSRVDKDGASTFSTLPVMGLSR